MEFSQAGEGANKRAPAGVASDARINYSAQSEAQDYYNVRSEYFNGNWCQEAQTLNASARTRGVYLSRDFNLRSILEVKSFYDIVVAN